MWLEQLANSQIFIPLLITRVAFLDSHADSVSPLVETTMANISDIRSKSEENRDYNIANWKYTSSVPRNTIIGQVTYLNAPPMQDTMPVP
jgi:hypothetical protein